MFRLGWAKRGQLKCVHLASLSMQTCPSRFIQVPKTTMQMQIIVNDKKIKDSVICQLISFVFEDFTMAPARPLSLVWAAVNRMTAESKRFDVVILSMVLMMSMMLMLMLVNG